MVAVSPFVGGRTLKGPTDAFCDYAAIERSAQGIAVAYRDVLDGVVADEPVEGLPSLVVPTLMADARERVRVATNTLDFAAKLR